AHDKQNFRVVGGGEVVEAKTRRKRGARQRCIDRIMRGAAQRESPRQQELNRQTSHHVRAAIRGRRRCFIQTSSHSGVVQVHTSIRHCELWNRFILFGQILPSFFRYPAGKVKRRRG